MKPLFDAPELLTLNGDPFNGVFASLGGADCCCGCSGGCSTGCVPGGGGGIPAEKR